MQTISGRRDFEHRERVARNSYLRGIFGVSSGYLRDKKKKKKNMITTPSIYQHVARKEKENIKYFSKTLAHIKKSL